MARRPKDDKPQDQRSNVPLGIIQAAVRECTGLHNSAKATRDALSACIKKWEGRGVPKKGIKLAIKAMETGAEETKGQLRESIRCLMAVGMPVSQDDIYEGLDLVPPKSKETAEHAEWEAHELGYQAGYGGKPIDDSPYGDKPGSEFYVKWRDGWQKGQQALAMKLFHQPEKADVKQASTRRQRNKETLAETEAAGQA